MKTLPPLLAAALGAFAVVLFIPFFFDGRVLWSQDIGRVYYPVATALARALRSFDASGIVWCPGLGAGLPLAADGVTTPFYPLHWLLLSWLPPARALSASLFVGYLGSGLAMAAYASTLGHGRAASAVAGLVYGWSGFAVGHSVHVNVVAGLPFLPLILLFLERGARGPAVRNAALAGACLGAQCLGGHPQVAAMSGLLGASYALFRWWPHPASARAFGRPMGLVALFLGLGAGLASVYYLPMAELASQSVRPASLDYRQAAAFALPWPHLLTALCPFLYFDAATGRYHGAWNPAEMALYAGLPSLVLAAFALRSRPRDEQALFFAAVGAIAIVLALGDATPLHGLLHAVPPLRALRGPARYVLLFDVAVAVLAARGFESLRKPETASLSRRGCAVLATIAVLAFALPLAEPLWRGRWASDEWQDALGRPSLLLHAAQAWLPAVWLLLTAFWLGRRPPSPGAWWAASGVALVALDLAAFAATSLAPQWVRGADVVRADAAHTLASTERRGRAYLVTGPEPWRSGSDHPLVSGFRSLNAYVSLPLLRHALFMRAFWMSDQTPGGLLDGAAVTTVVDSWRRPLGPHARLDGLLFSPRSPLAVLRPAESITYEVSGMPADRLQLVTSLADAVDIPQGTEVARVVLTDASGSASTFSLRAGHETAERVHRPGVAHAQPPLRTTAWSAFDGSADGAFYSARFAWSGARRLQTLRIDARASSARLLVFGGAASDGEGPPEYLTPFMAEGYERLREAQGAVLYLNHRARPRAYAAHHVVLAGSAEDSVRRVAAGEARDPDAVVLEDPSARRLLGSGPSKVAIVRDEPMHVELAADMKNDGYVVLADTFYPGWQATVDGVPTRLYAANGLFRAVFVESGAHRVRFDYRPRALHRGAAISAATLGVCLALVLGVRSREA